jgi:hypothetical protein
LTTSFFASDLYAYDAYGNLRITPVNALLTTFLYSGEMKDAVTGQQYLRVRYYYPVIGRGLHLARQKFAGSGQIGATVNAVDLTPAESELVAAGVKDLYKRGKNKNAKINKLYELLLEAPGNLRVKKAPLIEESAGMHVAIARGTLYVDEEAFVHGQNAVALVVFAEFQHDQNAPNYLPDDLAPEINDEFDAIRDLYKMHEQNLYIFGLRHPVPRAANAPYINVVDL